MKKFVLAAIGLTLAGVAAPSAAETPPHRTQAPGFYRMMVGEFEVTALSDGIADQPMDKLLTRIAPAELERLAKRRFLTFPVETSINAFLVNTGTSLVLVDSGAGGAFGPAAGRLARNLAAAGYRPDQVDAVLITHLHSDHSGGLAAEGKRLFPNATIYAHAREVAHWLSPDEERKAPEGMKGLFAAARAALGPYQDAGKLRTFADAVDIVPGVRAEPTPGHTPGHAVYAIESKGERMNFWGDLIHVADIQFAAPGIAILYDTDQDAAIGQRAAAFRDAADKSYWVAAPHIAFPGIGRLRAEGQAYDWVPAAYSLKGLTP
ncbi:MBL fold metallo-hydrolase [Sphingosinicella rhizophila]|uniref:MBL fold metallo-hydrolase n=1 Tax=Sphingosinicella rhizophila TaxID=3050082 RepID=A0ABU3QA56_9SPHN|nr:MBL fold metallo-hydrolase [Sphingosinicella sp. GR2756]MDT9600288.1 MBL fold metallo-hydrolase [Sphingosinicella sp. GR2756]